MLSDPRSFDGVWVRSEGVSVPGGNVSEGKIDVAGGNGSESAIDGDSNADCSHGLASTPKNISGAVVTLYKRRYMIRCSPNGFSIVSHISRQSS